MATGTYAPHAIEQFLDNNGNPLASGSLYTYLAGTTTPATTYTDVGLTVANANPIVLNAAGRPASGGSEVAIFLTPGASYKFVLKDSTGATIATRDNISAVPPASVNLDVTGVAGEALTAGLPVYLSDGSGGKTAGSWFKADATNPYSSSLPEVGMLPAAIASGASGTIRLSGQVAGLSSLVVGTTYYVGAAGALTATVQTNRRPLGVADTTSSLILAPNPPLPNGWTTVTITTTGTQNDWAPGLLGNTILRCNNATLLTVQGIAGGFDGQRIVLESIGAGQVDLAHQNAGSAAANRLINVATSGSTSLAAGSGIAEYVYDATTARWRLLSHEQGAWIAPTYAAGDFTTTGAGGWTVASGDVATYQYKLSGRLLTVVFTLDTTSVIAAVGAILKVKVPGGFTANKSVYTATGFLGDNAATATGGFSRVLAAGTQIEIQRNDTANFTASADATYVRGAITFEVQ